MRLTEFAQPSRIADVAPTPIVDAVATDAAEVVAEPGFAPRAPLELLDPAALALNLNSFKAALRALSSPDTGAGERVGRSRSAARALRAICRDLESMSLSERMKLRQELPRDLLTLGWRVVRRTTPDLDAAAARLDALLRGVALPGGASAEAAWSAHFGTFDASALRSALAGAYKPLAQELHVGGKAAADAFTAKLPALIALAPDLGPALLGTFSVQHGFTSSTRRALLEAAAAIPARYESSTARALEERFRLGFASFEPAEIERSLREIDLAALRPAYARAIADAAASFIDPMRGRVPAGAEQVYEIALPYMGEWALGVGLRHLSERGGEGLVRRALSVIAQRLARGMSDVEIEQLAFGLGDQRPSGPELEGGRPLMFAQIRLTQEQMGLPHPRVLHTLAREEFAALFDALCVRRTAPNPSL